MSGTTYLCKDCKHSFIPISALLWYSSKYSRHCKLSYEEARIDIDPVIGEIKKPGGYQSCSIYRLGMKDCGPEAKFWQPKEKKGLFKLIVKDA